MRRPDHFHAVYIDNGQEYEIKGGWTGDLPEGMDNWSEIKVLLYYTNIAKAWGMPEGARLKSFRLAG